MAHDPQAECERYDNLINEIGGIDLQLLGIGHNGHIGFNEPDEAFGQMTHPVKLNPLTIEANACLFHTAAEVPKFAMTMGIKSIMQARKIILIASGRGKADILYQTITGPVTPAVPASILQLHPDVTIVADTAALEKLTLTSKN